MSEVEKPRFDISPPAEFDVPEAGIHVRLFDQTDVDHLAQLASEELVQRYVPWARMIHDQASAKEVIDDFEAAWAEGRQARYAVEKDGQFVGYAGLWADRPEGYYEFGFAMLPKYRGQGIGTATVTKLTEIARDSMHANGIVAYVHDTNEASKSVIAKLGLNSTNNFDQGDRRYEMHFDR